MSNQTRKFFENLKQAEQPAEQAGVSEAARAGLAAVFPGLKGFPAEVTAELTRLGVQGQMELASALFNGNAFVPYGPGQYTPPEESVGVHGPQSDITSSAPQQPERPRERDGMER
jgi:hypothetical protein